MMATPPRAGGADSGLGDARFALGGGLANDAITPLALGGVEAVVGELDQRLRGVVGTQRRNADGNRHPAEPLDRFINSLAMTARRMWSATAIAERKVVLGSAMTNFSPP
jgi:hypothetical protein